MLHSLPMWWTAPIALALAANPHLDEARRLYEQLKYPDAVARLRIAQKAPNNSPEERLSIDDLLARSLVAEGKAPEAERVYAELLAEQPDAPDPADASPKIRDVFLQAKRSVYSTDFVKLERGPSPAELVEATLTDPWRKVTAVELDCNGTRTLLTPARHISARTTAGPLPDDLKCKLIAQGVDGRALGNVAWAVTHVDMKEPAPIVTQTPAGPTRWPSFLTGAVALGAIGAGTVLAVLSSNDYRQVTPSTDAATTRMLDNSSRVKAGAAWGVFGGALLATVATIILHLEVVMGAAGLTLGRYVLGERLAIGGMGEVYVGVQRGLGDFEKPLAIKLLLPHLAEDPKAVAEFLNEARVASRLSHPNVVQIFDVGQEEGRYYIAMELVRGISLSGLLEQLEKQDEQLPSAMVSFIAHGLLDGLHHAHQLANKDGKQVGLVHRDVSPHNVMVSTTGEVKLADFGIARAMDALGATRTGTVKGKPAYLAPELFDGGAASRGTDVFSAAVTIFHFATLRSPFRRDTDAATMKAVMSEGLPALRKLRPDLPDALDQALHWGTERDPMRRPPTALVLREAIPTTYGAAAVRELGDLFGRIAPEAVRQVEDRAAHTAQLARADGTKGLTRESTGQVGATPSRKPRWPFVAIPVLLAIGAAATLWLLHPQAEVSPVPSPSIALTEKPAPAPAPAPKTEPIAEPAQAIPPKAAVAEPVKPTTPTAPIVKPPAHVRAEATPHVGFLTVDAQPWANVSVRGHAIGDTPLYKFPIDEGDVTVQLTNPDTGKSAVRKVRVVRGKETSMKVNLQ